MDLPEYAIDTDGGDAKVYKVTSKENGAGGKHYTDLNYIASFEDTDMAIDFCNTWRGKAHAED